MGIDWKSQNSIEIRLYNDTTDRRIVEELFITGTKSLITPAFRQLLCQKVGVYIPLSLWCSSIASWLIYQTSLLIQGKGNKSIITTYTGINNRFQSWILVASLSLLATSLPSIGIYRGVALFIDSYTESSIKDDVRRIEEVYIKPGGTYLIAEDIDRNDGSRTIVGMVGGEVKDNNTAIELRRMSVHPNYQKRGIGKILIKALEERTIIAGTEANKQRNRMFLTCTSMQIGANRLYPSLGFQLKKNIYPPVPLLIQNFFYIRYYEKVYAK